MQQHQHLGQDLREVGAQLVTAAGGRGGAGAHRPLREAVVQQDAQALRDEPPAVGVAGRLGQQQQAAGSVGRRLRQALDGGGGSGPRRGRRPRGAAAGGVRQGSRQLDAGHVRLQPREEEAQPREETRPGNLALRQLGECDQRVGQGGLCPRLLAHGGEALEGRILGQRRQHRERRLWKRAHGVVEQRKGGGGGGRAREEGRDERGAVLALEVLELRGGVAVALVHLAELPQLCLQHALQHRPQHLAAPLGSAAAAAAAPGAVGVLAVPDGERRVLQHAGEGHEAEVAHRLALPLEQRRHNLARAGEQLEEREHVLPVKGARRGGAKGGAVPVMEQQEQLEGASVHVEEKVGGEGPRLELWGRGGSRGGEGVRR